MAVKNTTLGNVNLAEARLATKRTDVYSDLSADWLFDLLKKHIYLFVIMDLLLRPGGSGSLTSDRTWASCTGPLHWEHGVSGYLILIQLPILLEFQAILNKMSTVKSTSRNLNRPTSA